MLLGIDSRRDPWTAWQVRNAVYAFGSWFDARRNETVERPIPKSQKPVMRVPKYSEGDLRRMLGIANEAETEIGYRLDDGRIVTQTQIEGIARDILSGEWDDEDA